MHLVLATLVVAIPAPVVQRCGDASKQEEARALLAQVEAALKAGDAGAVQEAWAEVEAHLCFELPLRETARRPPLDDPEAMSQWWDEGGRAWLGSGLDSPTGETVVPPDAPARVKWSDAPGLVRLRCEVDAGPGCARETAGWRLRATEALAPREDRDAREQAERACGTQAEATPRSQRYETWRKCLEEHRPTGAMLPLGRFRAARDGWFVLRGRRGHYQFCDEVRISELATGAAWVAQSCSGLVLEQGGAVNQDATDAQRGAQVRVGRLPVEALREAAWMTLLARHTSQPAQPSGWYVTLPPGVEPRWTRNNQWAFGLGGFWASSAQTLLAWSWQGPEGLRASGVLTWPNSAAAGDDHAADLWRIAEAAFEEGCAPALPPRQLVVGDKPGVSSLDASPASLQRVEARLLEVLLKPSNGCRDGGR